MKSLPKVLFINHSVRDGGPGRSLFYILKYLDKDKIDPYVLIPKDDVFSDMLKKEGLGEKIIIEKMFPENLQRPRISTNNTNHNNSRFYHTLSILLNLFDLLLLILKSPIFIKKEKIRVIYCNGTQAKIVGAFMGLFSWCPVIWHVRNIQQHTLLKITMNALATLPVVKKIICVSNAAASQFHFGKEKLLVIHNGIDTEDFNPQKTNGALRQEYDIPEDVLIVGSTGRIVPRKGYEYLIKAASWIYNEINENGVKVKFVIVGDTPYFFRNNHLKNIEDMVTDLNLHNRFIFTGFKGDVKPYLKDFDIFVIPSNYPDPFPRTVIEAMSFAIPVVGFRVGGIAESISNDQNGFLCEPGNVNHLGSSILKLINDKALRKEMGEAGRERVERLFSAKERTADVQGIILEVLNNNGPN